MPPISCTTHKLETNINNTGQLCFVNEQFRCDCFVERQADSAGRRLKLCGLLACPSIYPSVSLPTAISRPARSLRCCNCQGTYPDQDLNIVCKPSNMYNFYSSSPVGYPAEAVCGRGEDYLAWLIKQIQKYSRECVKTKAPLNFSCDPDVLWMKHEADSTWVCVHMVMWARGQHKRVQDKYLYKDTWKWPAVNKGLKQDCSAELSGVCYNVPAHGVLCICPRKTASDIVFSQSWHHFISIQRECQEGRAETEAILRQCGELFRNTIQGILAQTLRICFWYTCSPRCQRAGLHGCCQAPVLNRLTWSNAQPKESKFLREIPRRPMLRSHPLTSARQTAKVPRINAQPRHGVSLPLSLSEHMHKYIHVCVYIKACVYIHNVSSSVTATCTPSKMISLTCPPIVPVPWATGRGWGLKKREVEHWSNYYMWSEEKS